MCGVSDLHTVRGVCLKVPPMPMGHCGHCVFPTVVDHKLFRCEPQFYSEENFTSHYLHRVPPDANVDYTVIVARCKRENPAGSIHLQPLLDENPFIGLCHAVRHHPRSSATRG